MQGSSVRYAGLKPPNPPLARPGTNTIQTASLERRADAAGVVLDYQTLNSSFTNCTFQADTTYYISGPVNLYGTTTIEGGTVIKYTNYSLPYEPGLLAVNGQLDCETAPYRPAIFTSFHDNSVGEIIAGSSGNPIRLDTTFLQVGGTGSRLAYLRFAYASTALYQAYNDHLPVWHSQFANCGTAIRAYPGSSCGRTQELHNVLMTQCDVGVISGGYHGSGAFTVQAEHTTADQVTNFLVAVPFTSMHGLLTNSILAGVQNILLKVFPTGSGTVFLDHCLTNANASGLYQAQGGGWYYLAEQSTNRNAGTTNISAELLNDLKSKTTHAPLVYSNQTFTADQVLTPRAQRDTDTPDVGYHYDPLDYCVNRCTISGSLTLSEGTSLGFFGSSVGLSGGTWVSQGSAVNRNQVVHYSAVQEQPLAWGTNACASRLQSCTGLLWRFTDLSLAGKAAMSTSTAYGVDLKDCTLLAANISLPSLAASKRVALTNNVFRRSSLYFANYGGNYPVRLQNNEVDPIL